MNSWISKLIYKDSHSLISQRLGKDLLLACKLTIKQRKSGFFFISFFFVRVNVAFSIYMVKPKLTLLLLQNTNMKLKDVRGKNPLLITGTILSVRFIKYIMLND